MVTVTKHVIPGPDLHCAGSLALNRFLQHLPTKYKWRLNKSYYLSAGPSHCAIWQIRRWWLHYIHKKFRWEPEVASLRTKTHDFTLVIRLNWLEKIELKGCAEHLGHQYYLLLITVVRKDAETNWKWRNKAFLSLDGISIEGARAPWATPLATPMILR